MGKKAHWIEGPDDEIPPLEVTAQARSRESPAVAIYARVSGPKQKSIPAQIAICRERCESKGWRTAYILQDHAMSAADLDRPAFQQLMDLIDREAIDVLVCWKLDRVVRSLRQAAELNEFATSHNVGVHSCTEPLDTTTPVGRFIFGNLANAAEFERDILKERTKMGIHARAAQGRWPRPFVPFGYRRAKAKYITPHPEEARMVNQVFEAYIKAESFPEASHLLNQNGAAYRNSPWNAERVRTIIRNPIYGGNIQVGDANYQHEQLRIVDAETISIAEQVRLDRRRDGKTVSASTRRSSIDNVFDQYFRLLQEEENAPHPSV